MRALTSAASPRRGRARLEQRAVRQAVVGAGDRRVEDRPELVGGRRLGLVAPRLAASGGGSAENGVGADDVRVRLDAVERRCRARVRVEPCAIDCRARVVAPVRPLEARRATGGPRSRPDGPRGPSGAAPLRPRRP